MFGNGNLDVIPRRQRHRRVEHGDRVSAEDTRYKHNRIVMVSGYRPYYMYYSFTNNDT